jgi:hypothetical protein
MNGDVLYAILMSFGWLFLLGWLALLLIACGLAFRSEGSKSSVPGTAFRRRAHEVAGRVAAGTPWKIHLRG